MKHIGFSFHDHADLLDEVLAKHPEVEFVQLQLNYLDWDSEGVQSRKCYEVAQKHGKPVFVMEPVKGGTLANLPEEAEKVLKDYHPDMSVPSWAIRFAASLPGVKMVLSGMSNMEQLLDNTGYMADLKPLTDEEHACIDKVVGIINSSIAIPCTACSYCTEGCPMHIAIPATSPSTTPTSRRSPPRVDPPSGEYYENLTTIFGKPATASPAASASPPARSTCRSSSI